MVSVSQIYYFYSKADEKVKLAFLNHLYFILFLQLASSRFSCTEFVFATFSYSVVLSGE